MPKIGVVADDWATAASLDEARYLAAVLNSVTLTELVRPMQARGEHNPRHFDKYVLDVPFPLYDDGDPLHTRLVDLARTAEDGVGGEIDEASPTCCVEVLMSVRALAVAILSARLGGCAGPARLQERRWLRIA